MPIIEITDFSMKGPDVYANLTEAQLRNRLEPEKGIFIAESPKVIDVALRMGYEPVSILTEQRHIHGDAADIISRCGDIPVYTAQREVLSKLAGFTLTRRAVRNEASQAPHRGGAVQRRTQDSCAGKHHGRNQHRRHIPLGGGAEH